MNTEQIVYTSSTSQIEKLNVELTKDLNLNNEECEECEECAICGDNLDNGEQVHILKCNHKFHLDCIYKQYIFSQSHKKRECPYCRKDGGFLPLKNVDSGESIPLRHINKEFVIYKKKSSTCKMGIVHNDTCKGIRKDGTQCLNKSYPGHCGFCRIHRKMNLC